MTKKSNLPENNRFTIDDLTSILLALEKPGEFAKAEISSNGNVYIYSNTWDPTKKTWNEKNELFNGAFDELEVFIKKLISAVKLKWHEGRLLSPDFIKHIENRKKITSKK